MKVCTSRGWYVTSGILIILLILGNIGGTTGSVARFLVIAFLSGSALVLILFGETIPRGNALLYASVLSPLLVTCTAIPFLLIRGSLQDAYAAHGVLFSTLLIIGLLTRGSDEPDRHKPLPAALWISAGLLCLLVCVPYLLNGALKLRSDSWFHAAVTESIARGGIPPEDPFYAGIGLRYFWAFHVFLLTIRSACGGSLFNHMAVISCFYFFMYLAAIYLFSRNVSLRGSGPAWSVILALVGVNFFGSAILLTRAFTGSSRGMNILRAIMNGGIHGIYKGMSINYTGSVAFFLDKFLVGTAFGMVLVMFLLMLNTTIGWLASGRKADLVMSGLLFAAALMFHTVVGLTILFCGSAALITTALRGWRNGKPEQRRRAVTVLIVLLIISLLCIPYLRTILSLSGKGFPLTFNGIFLWTVLVAGLLPLVLLLARWKRSGLEPTGVFFLVSWMAGVLVLGLFTKMPTGNVNKFIFPLFLPLIVLAGDGVPAALEAFDRRKLPGRFLAGIAVLLGAATVTFGLIGFFREKGLEVPVPVKDGMISLSDTETGAYRWMREQTPQESVFINTGSLDIPVMGRRSLLYSPDNYAATWGYGEELVGWRGEIVERIYGGRPLDDDLIRRLASLGRPVYIVFRAGDGSPGGPGMPPPVKGIAARVCFRNEVFTILEVDFRKTSLPAPH